MSIITESEVEQAALEIFGEMDYSILNGPDLAPDGTAPERQSYLDVVLVERLRTAVYSLNPSLPTETKELAIKKVLRTEAPELLDKNELFHNYLIEGVEIEYRKDGETRGDKVLLVDFEHPAGNEFLAINQFTVIENNQNKRPDIILFVNGLPLVVIELKNPVDEDATIKTAFDQLQTYKATIPTLFRYNAITVASDGLEARAGSLTSEWSRFMMWRTIDGKALAADLAPQMDVLLRGMLNPSTLLELIRYFSVFEKEKEKTNKKIAAYHQYYAVKKAVESTITAASVSGDKRAGVIWHTQGSGKSLSMVFYAGLLVQRLDNPTVVMLTDRNDLDDQLFETFANCQQLLRQSPVQADSRTGIQKLLAVASGGIVFTTIQKFFPEEKGGTYPQLSDRRNIVVIADEAHRSQYDFIDGFARHIRDALPNASFIGFTGTPIETNDRNTKAVFGNYIDIYDIQQAVDDGATVRIYYESRLAKIELKEEERPKIDPQFDEVTEGTEEDEKRKLRSKWAQLEKLVGAEPRLKKIGDDILRHFEARLEIMDGKALIVCMSRRICVDLYNSIIASRPDWHHVDDDKGSIKVVMTGSSSDPVTWQDHVRNKKRRKALRERMKDPKDSLKIVIVRDMWLTGFDVPCLHTMYLDKPMRGHNLMQAIARVNRVFKDKPGGLVVDYLGIAADLKKALSEYTESGGKGKPTFDQEDAVELMMEKHELVSEMFNGFDYERVFKATYKEKLGFIISGREHILSLEKGQEIFIREVTALSQAFALAVPHPKTMAIRDDVGYFQAVKAGLVKLEVSATGTKKEDIETALKQLISRAVSSDEVVDVFAAAGLKKPDISILSEEFLAEVKGMKYKNLAFELLKRLLNDEIKVRSRKNLIQSRSFSAMLEEAIRKYHNRSVEAAKVIEELIDLARKMRDAHKRGDDLKLSEDELAFYDALEVNDSAVKVLGDETLRMIARELVENVRHNVSIDWTIKESVQAKLRVIIKRILRKYGYPPDKQKKATDTVLEQAKLLATEWAEQ